LVNLVRFTDLKIYIPVAVDHDVRSKEAPWIVLTFSS
jgi:hypothetical protein